MFQKLTYKQKFWAVISCVLLLSMACYKKTFKHTIEAKLELNKVEKALKETSNVSSELLQLKAAVNQMDANIGSNSKYISLVQQHILNFISKKNHHINVFSINDVHKFKDQEFTIYSNQIDLVGSYKELMSLLYDLEKEFKNSRIGSVNFYSKKNYQTKTKKLHLNIIMQNYASNK